MTQNVDYGHVSNAEQALADARDAIAQILDDTQAAVSRLEGTWAGTSQDEYQAVQQRWLDDLQQMNTVLGEYIGVLNQMAVNSSQDLVLPAPAN
jgi:WXG100 family type VII secretion target